MLLTGLAANWVQSYLRVAQGNQEVLMQTNYTLFTAKVTRVFFKAYKKVPTAKQKLEKLYQQRSAYLYTAKFQ